MEERSVPVGGDFSRIFDAKDFLSMINTPDEAACVLRGHLILEEFLHLWIDKRSNTTDMFKNVFVPFKAKLGISRNLGLKKDYYDALDHVNNIRNRFGHRKGYEFTLSELESLADKIDKIPNTEGMREIKECRGFTATSSGIDQHHNKRVQKTVDYHSSNNQMKFLIVFIVLMLKLSGWLQKEFESRNIGFTVIKETEC